MLTLEDIVRQVEWYDNRLEEIDKEIKQLQSDLKDESLSALQKIEKSTKMLELITEVFDDVTCVIDLRKKFNSIITTGKDIDNTI